MARAVLPTALSAVIACGGSDAAEGDGDQPPAVDAATGSFTITNDDESGHVHELVIACADLAAGRGVSIVATGPHSHTVTLTSAQVVAIADGGTVTIQFTEVHSHTFVIALPADAC